MIVLHYVFCKRRRYRMNVNRIQKFYFNKKLRNNEMKTGFEIIF